mgnify:CR=1 FL=1|jgi:hypothetical protein
MKKTKILMMAALMAACSSMPAIRPSGDAGPKTACPRVHVLQNARFIHAIEFRAAGRTQTVFMGVTLVHPRQKAVTCGIVSAEGLSLFEATRHRGDIQVSRALPPFDAPDFARNLMEDVELIFLPPSGDPAGEGFLPDGRKICRWKLAQGGWLDISQDAEGRNQIDRYTEDGDLTRSVLFAAGGDPYSALELRASGLMSYVLTMTLIEAETVVDQTTP